MRRRGGKIREKMGKRVREMEGGKKERRDGEVMEGWKEGRQVEKE